MSEPSFHHYGRVLPDWRTADPTDPPRVERRDGGALDDSGSLPMLVEDPAATSRGGAQFSPGDSPAKATSKTTGKAAATASYPGPGEQRGGHTRIHPDPSRSSTEAQVAALFVDPKGLYPQLLGPENCWDEVRDARLYEGPHAVVAHPPCQLWVNMAGQNFVRYTRQKACPQPHLRPGNDGGCFARALECVRRFGGVLEHPAGSHAWSTFALGTPDKEGGWAEMRPNEWSCEVWQSAYGHSARKRTWLYYCGSCAPTEMLWAREPGAHQVGWFDRKKPTLGKREASATPEAFARALIGLAAQAKGGAL